MTATCGVCHGAIPDGVQIDGHTALCAEVIRRDLEEAMKAIAKHDGRSWCAVCGFKNEECDLKTPNSCLGSRARRMYPR